MYRWRVVVDDGEPSTLNPYKTEVIWCSSPRHQQLISNTSSPRVRSVRDLWVLVDASVTMRTHVIAIIRSCFASHRQIRSIRGSFHRHALLTLIRALMVNKIDYFNSVLIGLLGNLTYRFQSVRNAAGRSVYSVGLSDHMTPLLPELHWLRVP